MEGHSFGDTEISEIAGKEHTCYSLARMGWQNKFPEELACLLSLRRKGKFAAIMKCPDKRATYPSAPQVSRRALDPLAEGLGALPKPCHLLVQSRERAVHPQSSASLLYNKYPTQGHCLCRSQRLCKRRRWKTGSVMNSCFSKNLGFGAGKVAQWLRSLAVPPEQPGSIPSTYTEAHNSL